MFTDLANRLNQIAAELDKRMPDVIATQSMVELQAEWMERIFDKGLNSDGAKIGEYSTEPAYFTKKSFIRANAFKPKGKNSTDSKFKNGKQRKSMFLPGGYSEFRDIQGRENEYVKLKFSGSLERAFRVYKFGSEVVFGNADAAENKKVEGLEKKYGDWASLTQGEKDFLKENILNDAIFVAKG